MHKIPILLAIFILVPSCINREGGQAKHVAGINQDTMNTEILGLRTCAYLVTDLDKAKEWYAGAFGTEPYFDEPFYVGFNIGGYELGLMPREDQPSEMPSSVLTYWGVEDIQAVYDHLLRLGAKIHEEPHNVGGEIMVASVLDPWGNVLGIIYNPEFKAE